LNKEIVEEFYLLALVDITNGKDISKLEEAIDLFWNWIYLIIIKFVITKNK
tara:strand:- start:683 stop:835 length:153 start_codon:yes stop_codon:yes gene_type:complete